MKTIKYICSVFAIAVFIMSFYGCTDEEVKTKKDELTEYLVTKGGWTLNAVVVPSNTATTADEWVNFKVTVSGSTMNTSGHPLGALAVWPDVSWTMDENGSAITRSDGVKMHIVSLSPSSFIVDFSVPFGTVIGGRTTALDGDYMFELK